ncbi:alpha-mannosidase I MNS4 isoform X2 [Silene latifolia]|uniref:alpha-mannosidase I MNS4 isoform X2 n=1 Tax=Silene latifolia TaxID=37657 RepID=UPI003D77F8B1
MQESCSWFRLCLIFLISAAAIFVGRSLAEIVSPDEARLLRDEVQEMFYHAFNGYMQHAFPRDELKPLSCDGEDSLGGYALTLVDSLDTLALLGDKERFTASVEWIGANLRFDINKTVSVFETTIRVLGGLLSAHFLASDYATGMRIPSYDNQLLRLSEDLAYRMLPAFDTPTGIPFGSVNLLYGVDENESKITSTAGGGTLTLEFGILSRLTKNPVFEQVTKNAVRGLWAYRSKLNLVGAHINVFTGEWTQKDAGIGTSIDSFYEYLLKAFLLFGDEEYLFMFQEAYRAAMHYLFSDPWYVEVNMDSAAIVWPLFNSLQAFWPGLQVLAGDIEPAIRTHAAFYGVWRRYGFTPEGFNLATLSVQHGQKSYPLRPELAESTYWLYKATRDPRYLDVGRDIVTSLQYGARCPCGYCHITDVENHKQEDHMESFFLAETVKYLWLLFDLAVGPDNLVENGPYKYIFSTEGHLLPATPQVSLVREHCSYYGAYCHNYNSSLIEELYSPGISRGSQQANGSGVHKGLGSSALLSSLTYKKTSSGSALVTGFCPGLAHGQKFGISYFEPQHKSQDVGSTKQQAGSRGSNDVMVSSHVNPVHVEPLTKNDDSSAEKSSESGR